MARSCGWRPAGWAGTPAKPRPPPAAARGAGPGARVRGATAPPRGAPPARAGPPAGAGPLDRLRGSGADDPSLRRAPGWRVGHRVNTAPAYRRDLEAWARWCAQLGVHPLA